ncbi:hypothetical protein TNCV_3774501 [Trichonephila clavipes]|nr:hypothetical protein TNCV_3774501 [Trichonephila clavipes]
MLGPVDPRDVIYTKTRLRTPSTDQLSRRPAYRKKCTCIANCFISRHPDTVLRFSSLSESRREDILESGEIATEGIILEL